MIYPDEPSYNLDRPPVILAPRIVEFSCEICHKRGYGPKNARVHPGSCRDEKTRQLSRKTSERHKRERARLLAIY